MTAWAEVERLFELALAHDPSERAAVLAGAEPALRREVESLLAADAEAAGFLEHPGEHPGASDIALGSRIGPYRLIRSLGQGETSQVYLAARDDEFQHQVAIKLIRPGMDSRQILQRFHQERQILASLNHPNIAQLYDGGSTPAGQPYFVMEYVDGRPLDEACEAMGLSLVRRLELFVRVCQAVHAAHRSLIVHRDLKPGNILVDGEGRPKLVDFGIAKLLDPGLASAVEPTHAVARLMTPHYASPEQVQGKPVGTASDVYSLGVVLYKLVTGRRPYELGSLALHEIERVVCEATPPAPSAVAVRRAGWPRDLDNIVLMAMRKEPERRYASAQELADDLRRCLERRPVLARRDTLGYRASSFVRRNVGAVAAAAVIAACLIGGAVATTWQWRRAVAAQRRAETQRMTAEHTLDFVVDLFKRPDEGPAAPDVTARELLARGAARLRREPRQPPETHAALVHTLGVVYRNIGDYRRATSLLEDAVAARAALPGSELELADSLFQLGSIDADDGESQLADALLHRALAIRVRLLGADHLAVADVLERLAAGYHVPLHEAIDDNRRALDIRRKRLTDGDPRLVASVAGLAGSYAIAGSFEDARAVFREGLAMRDRAPAAARCQPAYASLLYEVAGLHYREGELDDAERDAEEAIACFARTLGPAHVVVIDHAAIRILIKIAQGRDAEAEALARASLIQRSALHEEDSPAVDNAQHQLARALYARGKLAEATRYERSALARRELAYGPIHASVAESLQGLGDLALAGGDPAAAEAAYRRALDTWRQRLGEDHPSVADCMRALAEALIARGQLAEARLLAERALALQRQRLRPGHPAIAGTLIVLAQLAASSEAAEPLLREALSVRRAALPAGHADIARAEALLADRCTGRACDGRDPKAERCDSRILTTRVEVARWPDPDLGPNRLDVAIHRSDRCGTVRWPFATTNHVCGTFSTWLEDAGGHALPGTRYDSTAATVQIYGSMWSAPARACASVCGHTVCSAVDP